MIVVLLVSHFRIKKKKKNQYSRCIRLAIPFCYIRARVRVVQ